MDDLKIDFIIPATPDRTGILQRTILSIQEAMRLCPSCYFQVIPVVSEKGPAENRQAGLERSTGDYIYYVDSDDQIIQKWMHPEMLQGMRDGCGMILFDSMHVPLDNIYRASVDNPEPGWPANRWKTPHQFYSALQTGTNQATVGQYIISKELKDIRWDPNARFEDYQYLLNVVKAMIDRKLKFKTLDNHVGYLYSLNHEDGRNFQNRDQ